MSETQTRLEHTLAELVAMPSETGNAKACHEIISDVKGELELLGLYINSEEQSDYPWLIATTQPTRMPKVMLVAHLDTVPALGESQHELRIDEENDKLYGRGVWDMKYAAACYIEFLKAHRDELAELDLGVLFTTDEETGGFEGAAKVMEQGWRTDIAIIPDYGEDFKIEEKAKGIYSFQLSANGKSAHGSRPWEGVNAAKMLRHALNELETAYPSDDPDDPTLSENIIGGGKARNQIPEEASAWLDFRAFTQTEINTFDAFIKQFAAENGLDIDENQTLKGAPLTLDKDNPLVREFMQSVKDVTDEEPDFQKSYGATDGRWFAEYGIPCIVTGPGGENAHGAGEWMQRKDLLTFYTILEHFVTKNAVAEKKSQVLVAS